MQRINLQCFILAEESRPFLDAGWILCLQTSGFSWSSSPWIWDGKCYFFCISQEQCSFKVWITTVTVRVTLLVKSTIPRNLMKRIKENGVVKLLAFYFLLLLIRTARCLPLGGGSRLKKTNPVIRLLQMTALLFWSLVHLNVYLFDSVTYLNNSWQTNGNLLSVEQLDRTLISCNNKRLWLVHPKHRWEK